ncbi:GATA transcription factor 16-like [Oryza brachyantha]|uniref:GATA transcription factor 16-like n=1 Tax=Oryza brachyantha TaxID=4533 RepID=UPI0007766956|nr:GATA transcription factor 16-like [Oryza brachyantha]
MEIDSVSSPVDKVDPDESNGSKACADCHTTKTPLWRGGPGGPKSLCNACGIRYRKRRRAALGLDAAATDGAEQKKKAKKEKAEEEDEVTVELHMVGFRSKDAAVLKQRRRMRRRKCLREEERAAILLMALSSGVIYA